jgi:hypothetical protein
LVRVVTARRSDEPELIELWNWRGPDGEYLRAAEIGRRLGRTKNSVVGSVDRLKKSGVLRVRGPSTSADLPCAQPLPPGARTLPLLPSELS